MAHRFISLRRGSAAGRSPWLPLALLASLSVLLVLFILITFASGPTPTRASGGIYRANMARTGAYSTTGLPHLTGLLWTYKAPPLDTVESPPLVSDGVVYVEGLNKGIHALAAATGQELWKVAAYGGPPTLLNDILYYAWEGTFCAMDVQTRIQKWHFSTGTDFSSPVIGGGRVYVGDADGYFYALDQQTGQLQWKLKAGDQEDQADSVAAMDESRVYFNPARKAASAGSDVVYYNGWIDAVDGASGRELWSFKIEGSLDNPIVVDGVVYCVGRLTPPTSDITYAVYALDGETGKLRWEYPVAGRIDPPIITVADGLLYIETESGLSAVDLRTRQERWKFHVAAVGVSVATGVVYFATALNLYALDSQTGKTLWQFPISESSGFPPVIADGVIYYADWHHVYAIH